jgi:GAF domain-containing protein
VAAFGDREMELMEAIAAQAAVAIENARLLSKEIS